MRHAIVRIQFSYVRYVMSGFELFVKEFAPLKLFTLVSRQKIYIIKLVVLLFCGYKKGHSILSTHFLQSNLTSADRKRRFNTFYNPKWPFHTVPMS
jgi:hypothetical protein